jgi:hypothetical protein
VGITQNNDDTYSKRNGYNSWIRRP